MAKKKFRFKLEVVERVRAEKEQQLLRHLAQAQLKLLECQNYTKELRDRLSRALLRREQLARSASAMLDYQMESQFVMGQKARIVQGEQAINRAKRALEKVLREYLQAKRALRAIELLREKAFSEYKMEMRRKEQKETEELYVMRSSRRSQELMEEAGGML